VGTGSPIRICAKQRIESAFRFRRNGTCSSPDGDARSSKEPTMSATSPSPPTLTHNYIAVRPDWLDRRDEPILEPELPIIDPHHHLWDRPGWRYLLDDLLADAGTGHDIRATVFVQARAMYRADGPEELKPVGETEFVNGVAAMCASGTYGRI